MTKHARMKTMKAVLLGAISIGMMQGCNDTNTPAEVVNADGSVITKTEQDNLTPDAVIKLLKEGNSRFMKDDITLRDHSSQRIKAVKGQFPKAFILSCVDSRVPVEDVFDLGIGDVFVGRVAGNFENVDLLGSMEFAHKVSGSKVLLVLGHESCGAVKAAIGNVELGNITPMLVNINPAVAHFTSNLGVGDSEFVSKVVKQNVKQTIADIRTGSPILKVMEDDGEIKIIGAYYNLETGKVDFL